MDVTDDIWKAGKPYLSFFRRVWSLEYLQRIPTFRVPGEISSAKVWKMQMFLSPSVLSLSSACTVLMPSQFLEVQAQHAFIRDESSKGRWDAALTRSLFSFMMEVFERTVGRDLGPKIERGEGVEHVC